MKQEKAHDFFSAYREGALDAGLRQQFEAKLAEDADLSSEFASFNRSVDRLECLKFEEIGAPEDLNERIRARLDLHLYEQRKSARTPMFAWWKNIALTGVAAGLVGVTFLSLRHQNDRAAPVTSGLTTGVSATEQVTFRQLSDLHRVEMTYAPSSEKTVVIKDGVDGTELRRIPLDGHQTIRAPLVNEQPKTSLMSVQIEGDNRSTLVALPGSAVEKRATGEGPIREFAVALASFYRQPIIVDVKDQSAPVTWNFTALDARHAASSALDGKYTATTLDSGLVKIMDR